MAVILATAFVAFALIGRVIIQFITTGNHGIRLADPRRDPVAAVAGAIFVLSFALSLTIVALDFVAVWRIPRLDSDFVNAAALAIGLAGVVLVVVAQLQMGKAWRIGVDPNEPTPLINHGLYRKSRNPIYFGLGLYWVGLAMLLPNPAIWTLAVLCWLSIEAIVRRVEEPHLHRLHGTDFAAYQARSNRYWIC